MEAQQFLRKEAGALTPQQAAVRPLTFDISTIIEPLVWIMVIGMLFGMMTPMIKGFTETGK